MEGYFIVLLLLYFLPSLIAGRRNHNNLNSLVALNILLGWTLIGWVAALIWSLANGSTKPTVQAPPPPAEEVAIEVKPSRFSALLRELVTQCQDACGDAFAILITAAKADGRISKDDLHLVAKFCHKHGAKLNEDWPELVAGYSSNYNLNIEPSMSCEEALQSIATKPTIYISTLHGTLTAMTIGAKRRNKTAERLTARIEALIDERSQTPTAPPPPAQESPTLPAHAEEAPAAVQAPPPAVAQPSAQKNAPPKAIPTAAWVEQAKAEAEAERRRRRQ